MAVPPLQSSTVSLCKTLSAPLQNPYRAAARLIVASQRRKQFPYELPFSEWNIYNAAAAFALHSIKSLFLRLNGYDESLKIAPP